jgi:hypothetical protein
MAQGIGGYRPSRPAFDRTAGSGLVNAVVIVGALHQAVHETVEAARAIVNAQGGTV